MIANFVWFAHTSKSVVECLFQTTIVTLVYYSRVPICGAEVGLVGPVRLFFSPRKFQFPIIEEAFIFLPAFKFAVGYKLLLDNTW